MIYVGNDGVGMLLYWCGSVRFLAAEVVSFV